MKTLSLIFFIVVFFSCRLKNKPTVEFNHLLSQILSSQEFSELFNQKLYEDSVLKIILNNNIIQDSNLLWKNKKIKFVSEKEAHEIINMNKLTDKLPPLIMNVELMKDDKNENVLEVIMLGNNHFVKYKIKRIKEKWYFSNINEKGVY